MRTTEPNPVLDSRRFTSVIGRREEFLDSFPPDDRSSMEAPKRRELLQRAIASSALSIAHEREQSHGEYDLDANLFKLVGSLNSSFESFKIMNELSHNGTLSPRDMEQKDRKTFYRNRDVLSEFNDILGEVINAGASKINFNELLQFMTTMYATSAGPENLAEFHNYFKRCLVGMRDEMAFEQVLIAAGIPYSRGDKKDDGTGGDFIIDDIPIDLKSSENSAREAQKKALRERRDPRRIIWSHISFDDFDGRLTLPYEATEAIFARLKPDLARIVPGVLKRKSAWQLHTSRNQGLIS